ncbi:glutathione S-transferase Mu 1-like [Bradysia coprophila]|uniref:glutathione S-transferase Mu 1-like n=1 Tax=Bradysia coprophila TaxID=38358 RepID=UPI00187D9F35|nr:glutathione S-transferase Mu 1-like [Bradysia coprophila]
MAPTLGYWNIRGIGNVIKFLMQYLDIEYKDKIYNVTEENEWFDEKFNLGLDFPNLPYYVDGDLKLTESKVIVKYIVRHKDPEARLYPDSLALQLKADIVENVAFTVLYGLLFTCWRDTEEVRAGNIKNHENMIKQLSDYLGTNNWILGEKLSFVDFWIYEALYAQNQFNPTVLDVYSNLKNLMKNFEALPAIARYMNSTDYIKTPCNSPNANRPIA